jgi:hypothetical protein
MMPAKNAVDMPRRTQSGRVISSVTLSVRARALLTRAARAANTTHSALVERLLLAHCEEIIAQGKE